MKNILKGFVAVLLCLVAFSAMADISTDMKSKFDNLPAAQQAALYKQVVDQQVQNNQPVNIDKVAEYTQLGTTIGAALAGTAKELGVVANDFLKTPVGMMAAGLIVWNIVGATLVHVFGGALLFTTFLPIWWISFKRQCLVQSITYTEENGKKKKVVTNSKASDSTGGYWVVFAIGVGVCALIAFTF